MAALLLLSEMAWEITEGILDLEDGCGLRFVFVCFEIFFGFGGGGGGQNAVLGGVCSGKCGIAL